MPRRSRKAQEAAQREQTAKATAEETPALPQEQPPAEVSPPQADGEQRQWVSKLPEPFPKDRIDIGGGRAIHFLSSRRWNQAQIKFSASEAENPKPEKQHTEWLKEHDWRWRSEERAWTKQFAKNSEKDPRARGRSEAEAQAEFEELGSLIRADKGLPPVAPMYSRSR